MSVTVAKVLLNLSLDKEFDYLVPPDLADSLAPGVRVNVPFGKSDTPRPACVVSLSQTDSPGKLKSILSICAERASIPENLLKLGEWIASYYCCTREQALRNLLPGAVRNGKIKSKTEPRYYLADAAQAAEYMKKASAKAKARCEILRLLSLRGGQAPETLCAAAGASKTVLAALVKAGLVRREEVKVLRDPFKGVQFQTSKPLTPTPDQAKALEKIFDMADHPGQGPHTLLLHGITCSGKTEVYLQAIAHILEKGGDAIVLVPEISLTPQTVSRFRSRFGDSVSVLHSGLTDGERYDEWMKVFTGKVRIAVGARSALFAPFKNLKLIIVDEEHENSYKQSEAPRYNARDVAVMRGKLEQALVILGSATPSLESWQNAQTGKYTLATMYTRSDPGIHLPSVKIIDMRLDMDEDKVPFFSKMLTEAIRERLRRKEQTILFLNKRGFARQMLCEVCGYVAKCPECDVPYTYHRKAQTLTCHLCGAMIPAPETCPECHAPEIRYCGAGTERIEHQAHALFPDAHIARMDSDTMTNPALYDEVLESFRRSRTDILIGTQMIAKGLDFPHVTLVGILNADMGLYLPDFRAQERTFQLLAQVAGRAGRGFAGGEVLIQTFSPFNPAIEHASSHDFLAFAEEELEIRKELNYPPFTRLCALHFEGEDPAAVQASAQQLIEELGKAVPDAEFGEPAPAPIERINGKYRFLCLAKSTNSALFRRELRARIMNWRRTCRKVDFYADIDALSLL